MDAASSVAIISDIHGNAAALEAVLADLAGQEPDLTVVAGDLALFGPRPGEAVAAVRGLGGPSIIGNTDAIVADEAFPDAALAASAAWTRERVGREGVEYLAGLPFAHRVTPPGGSGPGDDLLVVHATPTDLHAALILERNEVAGQAVTPEAEARRLVGEVAAGLVVFGHIHYASAGTVGRLRLASVGAVGLPLDGDPRAAYGLVRWDGDGWRVEHRRVAYDHEAVAAEVAAAGMPGAAAIERRLREARPVALGWTAGG